MSDRALETKASRIAKKLADALYLIECFDGDPEMVLDDANIRLTGMPTPQSQNAALALGALITFYTEASC